MHMEKMRWNMQWNKYANNLVVHAWSVRGRTATRRKSLEIVMVMMAGSKQRMEKVAK